MIGSLRPQPVGHREAAVEVAHIQRLDRRQLVDDRVGLRAGDGLGDLLGVERIDDRGLCAEVPYRRLLGLAPRRADDLMAGGHQAGHQLPAHRSCSACNEHFHSRLL